MADDKTFSINALAEETGKDRRTLKKLLRGLPPTEERDIGNGRIEKRWPLEHVELYLELHERGYDAEETLKSGSKMLMRYTGMELIPKLFASPTFEQAMLGMGVGELGLSKAAALEMLTGTGVIIVHAIAELFGDEHKETMQFSVPKDCVVNEWVAAKRAGRTDEYLAERWPDEPKKTKTPRAGQSNSKR